MRIVDVVPKADVDSDIGESNASLSESESETGHQWNPKGFSDLPSSQIEFELIQQSAKLRREGYKPPTLEDLKPHVAHVDIPDEDMDDATASLAEAEKETGVKMNLP